MHLDTLSTADLYNEIAELAREQGVDNEDDWKLLCDDVVESHLDLGELNDDQDTEIIKKRLYGMWNEYQLEAGEESLAAASEDPEAPHA